MNATQTQTRIESLCQLLRQTRALAATCQDLGRLDDRDHHLRMLNHYLRELAKLAD